MVKSDPKPRSKIQFPDRFTIGTPTPKPVYNTTKPKLEISQGEDELWYWTLIAKNGYPLAACINGFSRRRDCKDAQARVARNMREAKIVIVDSEE